MRENSKENSKKIPNLFILFDILLMFVVMLSLVNPKQTMSVNFERFLSIPHIAIIAIDKANNNRLIYGDNKWRKISENEKKIFTKNLIYSGNRDIYDTLPSLSKRYKINSYVYGTLYNEITSRVFSKCIVKDECQQNIEINITKSGKVIIN